MGEHLRLLVDGRLPRAAQREPSDRDQLGGALRADGPRRLVDRVRRAEARAGR